MMKYFFIVIGLFLSSCSVGPRYEPPTALTPSAWNVSDNSKKPVHLKGWWRAFHDPILNKLIEHSALYNLSLQMANARISTARTEYSIAFAQLFPRLNADALPPTGTGKNLTQVTAISALIEPDLFGKQRETRHRAQANVNAEIAERDFALLTLQAEIATSYLELRETQARIHALKNNLQGNRDLLIFLNSRYKSGLTSYINIAQQKALIEIQAADLEQNKAIVMMLLHKIELLTGNNPGVLANQLLPYHAIPQITTPVSLGIPSTLLCRRPDIIAAKERVEAAHANIRVAMANLFPQVNLGWLFAWQTQSIASFLVSLQHPESSFFGTLTAPLINMSLYRIVDLKKREKALLVLQYQLTVMRAFHEVETQYYYYKYHKQSVAHLKRALLQKKLILKLAKDTYQKGAQDFNTVIRAEEDVNHVEMSYLHTLVMYQTARINLYKALGGGF